MGAHILGSFAVMGLLFCLLSFIAQCFGSLQGFRLEVHSLYLVGDVLVTISRKYMRSFLFQFADLCLGFSEYFNQNNRLQQIGRRSRYENPDVSSQTQRRSAKTEMTALFYLL